MLLLDGDNRVEGPTEDVLGCVYAVALETLTERGMTEVEADGAALLIVSRAYSRLAGHELIVRHVDQETEG